LDGRSTGVFLSGKKALGKALTSFFLFGILGELSEKAIFVLCFTLAPLSLATASGHFPLCRGKKIEGDTHWRP
jgi:hypothetical protein